MLLMAFIMSFFVTPLGHLSKITLMRLFAFSPQVVSEDQREQIPTYNWTLKDEQWNFFNFERSREKVVLINFWASWRLPCLPELQTLQDLYHDYGSQIDFYIITDENREPVEEFMDKNNFDFPVTYLIIGDPTPVEAKDPPRSYVIDRKGYVVINQTGIADWNTKSVRNLLDQLLEEK